MSRRIAKITVLGVLAMVALVGTSRWLVWRSRYVTNAEIQKQATEAFEKENAENLAMRRGPYWRLPQVDERFQVAAKSVEEELIRQKEDPSQFRVKIYEDHTKKVFSFSVVHIDTISRKNRDTLGNPSGKDRWIEYDIASAKITRVALQQ